MGEGGNKTLQKLFHVWDWETLLKRLIKTLQIKTWRGKFEGGNAMC